VYSTFFGFVCGLFSSFFLLRKLEGIEDENKQLLSQLRDVKHHIEENFRLKKANEAVSSCCSCCCCRLSFAPIIVVDDDDDIGPFAFQPLLYVLCILVFVQAEKSIKEKDSQIKKLAKSHARLVRIFVDIEIEKYLLINQPARFFFLLTVRVAPVFACVCRFLWSRLGKGKQGTHEQRPAGLQHSVFGSH